MMKVDPDINQPLINIGNYYLNRKDTITALIYLEKAIAKVPDNYKLCAFLSNYYKKRDKEKSDKYQKLGIDAKNKFMEKKN